jgi:hypothetical protein
MVPTLSAPAARRQLQTQLSPATLVQKHLTVRPASFEYRQMVPGPVSAQPVPCAGTLSGQVGSLDASSVMAHVHCRVLVLVYRQRQTLSL